jgi:hypothetical protein
MTLWCSHNVAAMSPDKAAKLHRADGILGKGSAGCATGIPDASRSVEVKNL